MKVYYFIRWLKPSAIITIEPESRKDYFVRKRKKKDWCKVHQAMKIEQFEIVNIELHDNNDYGIIITVKEETL